MLCVSLMPETTDRAREGLIRAARAAEPSGRAGRVLAEIRLDAMCEFDLARLLADSPCPVIVTYRPRREGGLYDGPEGKRLETLRQAARLGARYIDVEHDALRSLGDVPPDRVIVSYHNFERTPEDLAVIHARLAKMGAAVVKVAVTANHILDTVPVLRLLKEATVPTIALSMGERGILTRILAPKFGGFLTYAADNGGREAGPGQVTVGEMCNLYRVGRIGPGTQVYGVIADPVGHSLSPRIHNAAFAETDLDAVYLPLWVEGDAAKFVSGVREFDFDGYSVTIPHKQSVMRAMDEINPLACRIGAMNTVQRRTDGSLFGTNTDITAGIAAIEAVVGKGWLKGKRALMIGAGGVGRAMAFGLADAGAEVTITDIDPKRAESLARDAGASTCPIDATQDQPCDILLNCTPVGMHPNTDASPVPKKMLREELVVYDAVYNPAETRLLREARAAGCRTVAGINHFIRQAVEQFELWTGQSAPVQMMRETVLSALATA
ncbi:MAG TPA: shikimate dehydrogenase [Phycisphaerae bacterium]|nr:shikimate dehydrogenase [Phycisphaerae bacterium]